MEVPKLEESHVRLEPLTPAHLPALEAIGLEASIWRYMISPVNTGEDLRAWLDSALDAQAAGTAMPWATIRKGRDGTADQLVGSTRFMDFDAQHRTVEIGNTWLAASARGTCVNTEAKLLQLTYAFETLGLVRVAFKTHHGNERSQAAIRALGATYEGTFRNHYLMPDGSHRHSVWFSIIDREWPEVKARLGQRIAAMR